MSGEEREGQQREILGRDIAHCDLCGMAVPASQLRAAESSHPLSDHDHPLMICPTCQERIQRGELDVETLLFDEDEYGEPGGEF